MNPIITMLASLLLAPTPTSGNMGHPAQAGMSADSLSPLPSREGGQGGRFPQYAARALARPDLAPWKRELLTTVSPLPSRKGGQGGRSAKVTSYCSACHDWHKLETCCEPSLHINCAAADRRYWIIAAHKHRKAVIWLDIPDAWGGPQLITLNDVGGAIKGRHRFDLCWGIKGRCSCNAWGIRKLPYLALRGRKPSSAPQAPALHRPPRPQVAFSAEGATL